NVAILDKNTGIRMKETRNFDTYGGDRANIESFTEFINYMNSIPDGEIVLLAVADEGGFAGWGNVQFTHPIVEEARQLLESLGSTMIRGLQYNGTWAMIAVKGEGALAEDINNLCSYCEGGEAIAQAVVQLDLDPDYGRREEALAKAHGPMGARWSRLSAFLSTLLASASAFGGETTRKAGEVAIYEFIRDIFSAHPIAFVGTVIVSAIVLGVALFFGVWRVFFPVQWHIWRLESYEYGVADKSKRALVLLGNRAVPGLLKTISLKDRPEVVAASSDVLGEIKEVRAIGQLIKNLSSQDDRIGNAAASALIKIDIPAVPELLNTLSSHNDNARRLAAMALGRIKDARAVLPLIGLLRDSSEPVRKEAAEALGRMQDPRALEGLIELLAESKLHTIIINAVKNIEDPKRQVLLINSTKNKDANIRNGCAVILGEIKALDSVPALAVLLKDPSLVVRGSAARALGNIGSKAAIPALVAALSDTEPLIRKAVADSLRKLGWTAANNDEAMAYAVATHDWAKLGEIGQPAIPVLKGFLTGTDNETRKSALRTLGAIKDPEAFTLIKEALKDSDISIVNTAVVALGECGDMKAVEILIGIVSDGSSKIDRASAAVSLGKLKDRRSVPPLLKALGDPNGYLRSAAAGALLDIQDPLLGSIVKYLQYIKNSSGTYGVSGAYTVLTEQQIELMIAFVKEGKPVNAEYIPPSYREEEEEYQDAYGNTSSWTNSVLDQPAKLVLRLGGASSLSQSIAPKVKEAIGAGRLEPEYAPDIAPWDMDPGTIDHAKEGMAIRSIKSITDILSARSWMWNRVAGDKQRADRALAKIRLVQSKIPAIVSTLYENNIVSAVSQSFQTMIF
ncbi:MAG TPA: HEAT repeat domain-containing protein, partial [Candidatus Omnitrophota bacterium]|nr:HEAT repeat domain-containing protein [Candidatus Omnitrophota bacterium]